MCSTPQLLYSSNFFRVSVSRVVRRGDLDGDQRRRVGNRLGRLLVGEHGDVGDAVHLVRFEGQPELGGDEERILSTKALEKEAEKTLDSGVQVRRHAALH
jgi:hypothetical protein